LHRISNAFTLNLLAVKTPSLFSLVSIEFALFVFMSFHLLEILTVSAHSAIRRRFISRFSPSIATATSLNPAPALFSCSSRSSHLPWRFPSLIVI